MVSLIVIVPKSEIEVARTALEEAGCGPNNLSVPMLGDQIVEEGQHTHLGCHWWATPEDVEVVQQIQADIARRSVVRAEPSQAEPLGLFNATLGDFVQIEHKQFGQQWGWRATMQVASGEFNPGVRAVAIYSDAEHQQYLYTTGAFTLQDGTWAAEWNEAKANKSDIHWAVLFASLREVASTLKADAVADVAYMRFGLPVPDGPVGPGVIEWAPGQVVAIGDLRTYQGITYRCRQAHTTQIGWTPPAVPALWAVD